MKKSTKDAAVRYDRVEALAKAEPLLFWARTEGLKYELAGSIRRGLEKVGDVDFIALSADWEKWNGKIKELNGQVWASGPTMIDFHIEGFPINIRFFKPEDWGAGLMFLTGSKWFNIKCRSAAMKLGMGLNQYGIFKDKARLGGETEEEVFKILGWEFVQPCDRK